MLLVACHAPAPSPVAAPPPPPAQRVEGRAYIIDSSASLLTIQVFRAGLLASAGHNHVIASHALAGNIHVTEDPLKTTFDIRFPVDQLTVDEPALRESLHREDFPPEVPESARTGTRHNMLGPALLDAQHHPEITLRSAGLSPGPAHGEARADMLAGVRGEEHLIHATVRYELNGNDLTAQGEVPLKQTELGLTPFTAFLGALAVQDEMHVRFELHAHAVQDAR